MFRYYSYVEVTISKSLSPDVVASLYPIPPLKLLGFFIIFSDCHIKCNVARALLNLFDLHIAISQSILRRSSLILYSRLTVRPGIRFSCVFKAAGLCLSEMTVKHERYEVSHC